jgi:hypothetical protein
MKIEVFSLERNGDLGDWIADLAWDGQRQRLPVRLGTNIDVAERKLIESLLLSDTIVEIIDRRTDYRTNLSWPLRPEAINDAIVVQKPAQTAPPRFAEFLFSLLAPKKSVDVQLGDLQEIFEGNVDRFGVRRARMLYWAQVLRAIGPGIWRRIKKLGFVGILIDYGRSKIGL